MTKKKQREAHEKQVKEYVRFSAELAIEICDAIGTCTDTLDEICAANPHFPTPRAIHLWKYKDPEFRSQYMSAKSAQADIFVEQLLAIAFDTSNDYIPTQSGLVGNPTAVARSRCKIFTIQWIASRLLPRLYGNKLELAEGSTKQEMAELADTINNLIKTHEREY